MKTIAGWTLRQWDKAVRTCLTDPKTTSGYKAERCRGWLRLLNAHNALPELPVELRANIRLRAAMP